MKSPCWQTWNIPCFMIWYNWTIQGCRTEWKSHPITFPTGQYMCPRVPVTWHIAVCTAHTSHGVLMHIYNSSRSGYDIKKGQKHLCLNKFSLTEVLWFNYLKLFHRTPKMITVYMKHVAHAVLHNSRHAPRTHRHSLSWLLVRYKQRRIHQ